MLGLVPPLVWSGNPASAPDTDPWVSIGVLMLAAVTTVVAFAIDRRVRVRPANAVAERDRLCREEPVPTGLTHVGLR